MWTGPETRCTLMVPLRRYHDHLLPGLKGTLLPGVETTSWGKNPRFGAVRFDCCGHTLDIVLDNLVIDDNEAAPRTFPVLLTQGDQEKLRALLADIE